MRCAQQRDQRPTPKRSRRSALRHDAEPALGRTGDGHLDAQPVAFDLDLETADAFAEAGDVLIEAPYLFARTGALARRGPARPAGFLLAREILLGDA